MTHYERLQISETADTEVIDSAWKVLMRRFHPDRNPNNKKAAKQAQLINEAHDVLSDPTKRAAYDQFLQSERKPKRKPHDPDNDTPTVEGQRFDEEQGFYPPAYGSNTEGLTHGQFIAMKIGEAFLEQLSKQNPALRTIFNAAKGAIKR
jgi:curved DNA-binding protein CbpA